MLISYYKFSFSGTKHYSKQGGKVVLPLSQLYYCQWCLHLRINQSQGTTARGLHTHQDRHGQWGGLDG